MPSNSSALVCYHGPILGAPSYSDISEITVYHLMNGNVLHTRKVPNDELKINDFIVSNNPNPPEDSPHVTLEDGKKIYFKQVTDLQNVVEENPSSTKRPRSP